MYKILVFLMFLLFACSEEEFNDNLFSFDTDAQTDSGLVSTITFSLSSDSVEVRSNMYVNVIAENIAIDSVNYDFNGDDVIDFRLLNYVRSLPHTYEQEGVFEPKVFVYSTDSTYELTATIVVVKEGSHFDIEEVVLDTVDSLADTYVEDSTLSVGSAPIIAFLGNDILYLNAFESFVDPGAIAFDDEDGEIKGVYSAYDDLLLSLPDESIITKTGYITYKIKDSHGNITERERKCLISNPKIIYDFDFTTIDIDGFVYDRHGNKIRDDGGYFVCDELDILPVEDNNNFYFDVLLTESSKKQTLFDMSYFYRYINSSNSYVSATVPTIKINTYNDTLETIVTNSDGKSDTFYFTPITSFFKRAEYLFSIQKDMFKLYIDKELMHEEKMNDDYSELNTLNYTHFNFGADRDGENICGGSFFSFKILQLEITDENIGEME